MQSLSAVKVVTFIGNDRGANDGGFPIVCKIIVLVELMDDDKVTTRYEVFVLVNKHGVQVLPDVTSQTLLKEDVDKVELKRKDTTVTLVKL